jgi:hypothetical protein
VGSITEAMKKRMISGEYPDAGGRRQQNSSCAGRARQRRTDSLVIYRCYCTASSKGRTWRAGAVTQKQESAMLATRRFS